MSVILPTPRAFISYSWTSEVHLAWVIALAERLRNDGVDIVLDQWDLEEGHDKYVFMESMVVDPTITKVLAICDKRYADRADGREGGVGTESQIISKQVYDKADQKKFIPLVRERDSEGQEYVPVFFAGRKYIDFSDDTAFEDSYDKLIRNLFGKPERVKPKLGSPPAHLLMESGPTLVPAQKLDRLKEAVLKGKTHIQVMVQDYLDCFLECMEEFRVTADVNDFEVFDAALTQSIASFAPFRDNFIEFVIFCVGYINDDATRDKIASFLECFAAYQERPDKTTHWNKLQLDNYSFVAYELFLYLLAGLIKKRAFEWAAHIVERRYLVQSTLGGSQVVERDISVFNRYNYALDEYRNQKMKANRLSITADLVKERATNKHITLNEILQADFLLFVREFFPNAEGSTNWYPRCAVWLGDVDTLEIFARACTKAGCEPLKTLLRVTSIADLAARLNQMLEEAMFQRIVQSERMWISIHNPRRLLNIGRINELAQKQN